MGEVTREIRGVGRAIVEVRYLNRVLVVALPFIVMSLLQELRIGCKISQLSL